ncbi:hypothetical protein L211DRAFT_611879 [Terfezia boudieri ATCC MYA-4762]|uniref:Uncharacterized protein n=1 Tax=Terfezia boudieri ATCC MYA-4762 TaxID=1051890 RepID=A0A3N4LZR3_9PEZI|nr:hypothetical protein L211DRAFT_611879 [Terfezia boudieri ATCC MYA-4762]
MTSEQYIASAKQGLINARSYLNTPNWRHGISAVRTCISYVNAAQIMFNDSRLDERLWILNEVQQFSYNDLDAGGVKDLATWCEIEYNRILSTNPSHVGALRALGQAWLWKSQYWLAKVCHEDRSDDDDDVVERRRYTPNYVEARAALMPAVDFLARAADGALRQNCLTGELLALRAEACMSLGNVSPTRDAQVHFKTALRCLRSATMLPSYQLPNHLVQYLRENEHLLRM